MGGLNSVNYTSPAAELPVVRTQSVERWDGRSWVTVVLSWNEELGRYE